MALTKKHFIAIAADFKRQIDEDRASPDMTQRDKDAAFESMNILARKLSNTFRAENSNFDGERFLAACGF